MAQICGVEFCTHFQLSHIFVVYRVTLVHNFIVLYLSLLYIFCRINYLDVVLVNSDYYFFAIDFIMEIMSMKDPCSPNFLPCSSNFFERKQR